MSVNLNKADRAEMEAKVDSRYEKELKQLWEDPKEEWSKFSKEKAKARAICSGKAAYLCYEHYNAQWFGWREHIQELKRAKKDCSGALYRLSRVDYATVYLMQMRELLWFFDHNEYLDPRRTSGGEWA